MGSTVAMPFPEPEPGPLQGGQVLQPGCSRQSSQHLASSQVPRVHGRADHARPGMIPVDSPLRGTAGRGCGSLSVASSSMTAVFPAPGFPGHHRRPRISGALQPPPQVRQCLRPADELGDAGDKRAVQLLRAPVILVLPPSPPAGLLSPVQVRQRRISPWVGPETIAGSVRKTSSQDRWDAKR